MEAHPPHPADGRAERARRLRRHAIVLLVVVAVTLVVPTTALLWRVTAIRGWAASRIVAEMSAALDAEVSVEAIDLRPGLPPQVILQGLRVTRDGRVIAQVGRLVAEPRLPSLAKGQLDLASLVLEHAHLELRPDDLAETAGRRPGLGSAAPRIEALQLRDSSLSFRHAASGFELDVPQLSAGSSVFFRDGRLFVHVEGEGARVVADGKAVQPVDFSARIGRDDRGLRIDDLRATSPGLSAWVHAAVDLPVARENAAPGDPSLRASLELECATGTLVALGLLPAGVPDGMLEWDGELRATPRGWSADGSFRSDSLELRQDLRPTPILRDVRGKIALSTAAFEIQDLHAELGRGQIAAEIRGTRSQAGWLLDGSARVEELPLSEVPLPRSMNARRPDLRGSIGFDLDGTMPLAAPADARLSWSFGISSAGRAGEGIPLVGEGRGRWRDARAEIEELDLSLPGMRLALRGTVALDGALDLSASLKSPQLADALAALRPHVQGLEALPNDLRGAITAAGPITGSLERPELIANVEGAELSLGTWSLGALDARVAWSDGLTANARVEGEALTLELDEISGGVGRPLRGRWEIRSADAGLLARFAGLPAMSGSIAGSGSFAPGEGASDVAAAGGFVVAGTLEGQDLSVAGQRVESASLEGRAGALALDISRLDLASGEARASGSGRMPWAGEGGDALIAWTEWPIELQLADAPLTMRLSGEAAIAGSVRDPVLVGAMPLRGTQVRWRALGPRSLEGEVRLLDEAILLAVRDPASGAAVDARLGRGDDKSVRALGTLPQLPLVVPTGESGADVALLLDDIDLIVDGSLADVPNIRIEASAQGFSLRGEGLDAKGTSPLKLIGPASRLSLQPATLSTFGQEFAIGGSASIVDPVSWQIDAEGLVHLSAFGSHLPGARLEGKVLIDLHAAGGPGGASLTGSALIEDGYLNHPAFRQSLRELEAEIALDQGLLRLERMEASIGGGLVTATGRARLAGWRPSDLDVQLKGDNVALRIGEHFRVTASFDLDAESRGEDVMLSGDVQLLRARLTTPADLGGGGSRLAQMRPPGPLDSVLLDLRVRAPDQFVIDNDAILAEFEADLDVVGTGARPIVLGSLDIVRQGKLFYKRTEFALSDASFQLTRAFPGDPEIDAHASARLGFHDIEMRLSDRASEPHIELSSVPELAEESLVAMLATSGRLSTSVADAGGAALPAPFARSATGMDSALSAKGVDPIRLDPVFVEGSVLPSARLTVGEQLTNRLFAGYSMSLRGDQEGTMELRYLVKPRLELRFAYEEGGSNVGEVRWTRSWRSAKAREVVEQALAAEEDATAALVRSVSIPGLTGSRIAPEQAMAALDLAPGSRSTKPARLRAAGRLREFLVEAGHPLARVTCVDVGIVEDGEVDVSCSADLGPFVNLILEGLTPETEKIVRPAVIQAWGELAFRDELVTAAAVAAQDALLARGYARVTARARIDDKGEVEGSEMDVRLTLIPGDVIRVQSVDLSGVESIEEKKLRRALVSPQRQGWKHQKLTPALREADRDTLLGVYQAAGFIDASVSPPVVTYPTDEPRASLEFRVQEGDLQRIVGVSFSWTKAIPRAELEQLLELGLDVDARPEPISREALEARLPVGIGDIAQPEVLDEFARQVSEDLDAMGYPDAVLSWRLRPATGGRILECVIVEGPEVTIGDVRVEGLVRTRESVVRREIRLEPGAKFQRKELGEVRKRLSGLGLFQSIVVRAEPRTQDVGVRDVLVRVVEKPRLDMAVGFGLEDSNLRGSFSIGQRNVGGTGASLGLQLHAAGSDQLARALAGLQRVGGTRNDLLLVAGFERDDRPGFTSDTTFVGAQMSRQITQNLTLLPRFRWEDVSLPRLDVSPTEARLSEGIISGPGVALLWDTRDDPFWPTRGSVASLDLSLSADTFGADHSFTKAFAQYSIAHQLRKGRLIAAGSIRAGAGWSFDDSDQLPLSERFFAGGVASVRGWELDHLGPKDLLTGEPVGGDAVLVLNSELRARISRRAWFIGFVDAGNVFESPSGLGSPSLELTFGPGIGLSTPIGPLRFYYGQKLEDPADEPSGEFHFTFGGTF